MLYYKLSMTSGLMTTVHMLMAVLSYALSLIPKY